MLLYRYRSQVHRGVRYNIKHTRLRYGYEKGRALIRREPRRGGRGREYYTCFTPASRSGGLR
jgi:hypothetical protein